MPETPPPSATPPPAQKPRQARGQINQAYLDELKNAAKVAKSTADARYAPRLAEVDLDPALLAQATALLTQIKTALGLIKGARTGRKMSTAQEKTARETLIALLSPIQSAAKRLFEGDTSQLRENYSIGQPLASLPFDELLVTAGNILLRLTPGENNAPPADTLPGIKPGPEGAITKLAAAIAAYTDKDEAQGNQQTLAAGTLESVATDIALLAQKRRAIQLAADQAWSWRAKSVATIRKAFLLPTDRPLTD